MTDTTEAPTPAVVHQPRRWKLHAPDPSNPKWPLCNTRYGALATVPSQVDCGTCRRLTSGPREEAFHIWIARSPEGDLQVAQSELDSYVAKIIVYTDEHIKVER